MGRTRIELLSSGDIDMYDDVSCSLTFAIADIREPDKRNSHFSKTIKVPATKGNNIRFANIFDLNVRDCSYNANRKASCTLYIDDVPQLNGFLQIFGIEINDKNDLVYNLSIKGNVNNIFQTLGDDLLTDLDLSEFNHVYGVAEQYASWYNDYTAGYCYPLIDYGFDLDYNQFEVETLFPAVYLRTYIDKIFSNAGFTYSSTFFDSTMFKHLIIPCTGENFKLSDTEIAPRLFEASRSSVQNIAITSIGLEKRLQFDTDVSDPSNQFNTGTYKFTPANAGYYDLFADCSLNTSGTIGGSAIGDGWLNIVIDKGGLGTEYKLAGTYCSLTGTSKVFTASAINTYLSTSDVVSVKWTNGAFAGTTMQVQFNSSSSRFYNKVTNQILKERDTIDMSIAIPKNIKQKDLLLDVCRMFNLYIETDKENSNKLFIETRNDFYSSGTTIDWTYKLDNSQPLEITPMGDLDFKKFKYSYKQDKDFYNNLYSESYGADYGNRVIEVDNDFLTAENETKVMFSATPLVCRPGSDRVIPQIMTYDSVNNSKFVPYNVRILYNGGVKTTNITWQHGGTIPANVVMRNEYLYAGHLDSVTAPTIDLNFGVPKELYYTATTYTNANLYNLYHRKFIEEITDIDSKVVTGYFYLTPYDIAKLDFRNKFYFENQYFRLNKIYDYNPITESVTKCEFIKVKDGVNFTGALAVVLGGYTEGFLTANDVNDFKPTTRPYVVPLPVIDLGDANVIGNSIRNSYINGDYNYVHGGRNINLLGSSGNIIYDGLENVTLINTSGTTVSESNTLYVNGYQITSGTIEALSSGWKTTPFSASNFTVDAGLLTVASGEVYTNRYVIVGKTMTWQLYVNGSSLDSGATYIKLYLPVGKVFKSTHYLHVPYLRLSGTYYNDIRVVCDSGTNYFRIYNHDGSTFPLSTLTLSFTYTFEIE
jgi:hypothetical protein